ncbi:ribosome maturation factor RimP [Oecophyllibacter saccharovorans]|uniref:ribosome maturation factor RimP n=1 Tax=Oecophyllibacter saccharovorans TaxID=2558360 RepID=UPI001145135B|nr:ribosome maturation factor RimP [Oecophyllibacter saccharovorans]QDH16061.1 ribosome maturation factor RimP [Oecophyllibacter saccharovorans]
MLRLTGLESRIADRIAPTLADMGFALVRLAVLGRETPTVQIMADRSDGGQISVEDCEQISHAVGAVLDVDDPIPGAWTLEVSSAGIDRPMTRVGDWERFAGHLVKVEMDVPIDGRKRFAGTITGLRGDKGHEAAVLRMEGDEEVTLPLREMRKARLVLTDALIEASAAPGSADGQNNPRIPKLNPQKPGKSKKN